MNYRRLLNGYGCQRGRGKSHYQLVIESLAKLLGPSTISSKLMRLSLSRHGLYGEFGVAEVLNPPRIPAGEGRSIGILSGRFFIDPADDELWSMYRGVFADKIQNVMEDAGKICRHEFSLLGAEFAYNGHPIDWHLDPVSGHRWPKKLYSEITGAARSPQSADIKYPWELSRMQHLPTLGKAYRLTNDERYAREIVAQVTHWLDDNPCPYCVNWTCAMDVAIRIMNILWGYLLIKDSAPVTNEFRSRLAVAVFQHGQYILFNLEYGLREDGSIVNGNHFLTNVVGLLHLGLLCPEMKMAETWKNIGVNGLIEEIDRQALPDGVNYESSTSYHRLVIELFTAGALLCRLNGVTLPERFWHRLERMYEFVMFAARPDGTMPLVGDADDGRLYILSDYGTWKRTDFCYLLTLGAVLFHRSDMKARAGRFSEDAFWWLGPSAIDAYPNLPCGAGGLESKGFPDAGLYVMRRADRYLLACCSRGADGVTAHKHNDLLSFEICAGGKALIVDPGAYLYTRDSEWRNLFRSTRYHNTVVIDGQEQNRFDPERIFQMTLDASVIVHQWRSTPSFDLLDAEHTGYRRLVPPVKHRRTFTFEKQTGIWEIADLLSGEGEHTADWYLHFDSGIALSAVDAGIFEARSEGVNLGIAIRADNPIEFSIEDGWVSREYGRKVPAKILHMSGRFTSECRSQLTMRLL